MRRLGCGIVALTLAATSSVARAQPSQAAAAAATLFDRGLADMQAGNLEAGCPALHESYRLDPRPGTLFTAAECEAKRGKVASALAGYTDFLAAVGRMSAAEQTAHARRAAIATEQKARLAGVVPKLLLTLPGAAASVEVELDGTALGAPSLGVPLPVNPGEHRVVTRTRDGEREKKITIALSEEKRVALEVPAAKPTAAPPPAPIVTPRAEGPKRRPFAYAAFALGAAGLGAGAVGGALTLAAKSTIDDQCQGVHCTSDGKAAGDRAQVTGLVSTIGFVAGGAGAALGVILWVTDPAPAATPARTGIALGPGSVSLSRSF